MLDNFSSALQLAMSYLKPRLATWKSSHPCWVPSRCAWHGPRRQQQRCNNCCNNEGRRWLEDGRIFVVLKIWWGIPTKTCFCWWNGSQHKRKRYISIWGGVGVGWDVVGSKLMRVQERKFMIDFGTWHVEVSQHDYWMLLISIGHILLEILGTLVVGLAEIDSSLLGLMLWASLFYYYYFWSTKMHLNHVWSVYSLEGNLDGDPLEIWFRVAE